jgi:glutaredoxin
MKFARWVIGKLILCLDFITRPKPLVREESDQKNIDSVTSHLSLYQFNACPFCVKVRRKMRRLSLNIELKDAKNNFKFKEELVKNGGKHKVPCLRINYDDEEVKWIYGSDEINDYLDQNFKIYNESENKI